MSSLGRIRARRDGEDITAEVMPLLAKRSKVLSNAAVQFLTHHRGLTTARAKKLLRLEPPAV